ncbi:hypothetical protein TrRE_jg12927 [Triparma retinervis]|uniref:Uncharacterized protein n=1 Tax=Triparma retinervis TaxID=2557542 RepID=A0A9W6ZT58_9STRA|nr:hypothetical protein TrRE_jg12927 [Triparma retinervis]
MAALTESKITMKLPGERELVSTVERVKQLVDEVKASCEDLTKIHELVLGDKSYTAETAKLMSDLLLRSCTSCRRLNLADVIAGRHEDEGLEILDTFTKAASETMKDLEMVDLSDNAMGLKGISKSRVVIDTFRSTIRELYMCNDGLSHQSMKEVREIVTSPVCLQFRTLHFFNNMSGDEGCREWAAIIAGQSTPGMMEDIRFSGTRAGKEGSVCIAKALEDKLQVFNNLRKLDLADNTFSEGEGGDAIASFFSKGSFGKLEYLNLRDCAMGDKVGKEVLAGLKGNTGALKVLDLSGNDLTGEEGGAQAARELIVANKSTLLEVYVDEQELGSRGLKQVLQGAKACEGLGVFSCVSVEAAGSGGRKLLEVMGGMGCKVKADGNGFSGEIKATRGWGQAPAEAYGFPPWMPMPMVYILTVLMCLGCAAAGISMWAFIAVLVFGKDQSSEFVGVVMGWDKPRGGAAPPPAAGVPSRSPTNSFPQAFSTDPSTELLLAWAEGYCGAKVHKGVSITPFPTLSTSTDTTKVARGVGWLEWLGGSMRYRTTSRQHRLASSQPFYSELTHPASGLAGSSPDTTFPYGGFSVGRSRGPLSSLARFVIMERWWDMGIGKVLLWVFNPFYWGEGEAEGESIEYIMSGGGRGVWFDPTRDPDFDTDGDTEFPVITIPPGCQMTSSSAIRTLMSVASHLVSLPSVSMPMMMSYAPPYVSSPSTTHAKLVTPHQEVDLSPSRRDVISNFAYMSSQLDDGMLVAVWLARERWRGERSEWAPYIRTLPGVTDGWGETEWGEALRMVEERGGNARKLPTKEELHRGAKTPPPATCGWMVEGGGRGRVLEALGQMGVNVDGWDKELEGVGSAGGGKKKKKKKKKGKRGKEGKGREGEKGGRRKKMELSKVFDKRIEGEGEETGGEGSGLVPLGGGRGTGSGHGVKVGDHFEGTKVEVPPHKAPPGAGTLGEEAGTMIVWASKSRKHEVLVNYSCDGYSPLDWFLNFGFVPLERRKMWRREPECLKTKGDIHVQNNGEGGEGETFKTQQRRGEKWRREKEGK